ncbi:adenylate/guanylate cyclase domain-containing protein, partial [Thermodesulfobacteriota bacterium]
LQKVVQLPIVEVVNRNRTEKTVGRQSREKAKRRLLNLPFIIMGVNLSIWVMMASLLTALFLFFTEAPLKTHFFILFRGFMIGLIAASLSFFSIEDYSRKTLIPLFFPKGKLAVLQGTVRVPILRRIRILYTSGTFVPMIILVGTLLFVMWDAASPAVSIRELSREILVFTILLCFIFLIIALRLNFLVGKSILNPIEEMLDVVDKVRIGDFTQRVQVLSNDEIGVLGDTGNEMIAGLADRENIRESFGKYVTPEIRDLILAGRIPLDGEKAEATLLFTDLRGFTSYVEETPSEDVIRSMRAYFTAMQTVIRSNKGLVLQYVGDEVEAVFGIPIKDDDQADRALRAALEMRKRLDELNRARGEDGKPPFRHGVGIHTGVVLAGNTGSEDRPSYALIGDTVNLASRIQELTKHFKCDILVSESTVKQLKGSFSLIKQPPQPIKGHSKPITVYQLIE